MVWESKFTQYSFTYWLQLAFLILIVAALVTNSIGVRSYVVALLALCFRPGLIVYSLLYFLVTRSLREAKLTSIIMIFLFPSFYLYNCGLRYEIYYNNSIFPPSAIIDATSLDPVLALCSNPLPIFSALRVRV